MHSDIINQLYDHIGKPDAWRVSLENYLALMEATTYSVGLCDDLGELFQYIAEPASMNFAVGREPVMLTNNVAESYFENYHYYFEEGDPIAQNTIALTQEQQEGVAVNVNTDLRQFKIFEELAIPNGLGSVLNVWSDNKMNDARKIQLAFFREDADKPFNDEHVAMVNSDMTHLKRTIYLHCQAVEMQSRIAKLESIMDAWKTGLLFCNTQGRLLHANARGRELINGDEFPVLREFLGSGIKNTRYSERLKVGFLNALSGLSSCAAFPAVDGSDSSGIVMVALGIQPLNNYGLYTTQNGVVYIILERQLSAEAAVELATQAYKLSAVEAKLLHALVNGVTPSEFANTRGVKISTVRTQISQLLAKTKTKRQQDLLVLISRMMGF